VRCKYAVIGSLDRQSGQAHTVQKALLSQARPMRIPPAFSPSLARTVQVCGSGECSAMRGKARVTTPIHASHRRHGGGKAHRVSLSFAPFTTPISVVEAAPACHSLLSEEGEESFSPLVCYSFLLQVCAYIRLIRSWLVWFCSGDHRSASVGKFLNSRVFSPFNIGQNPSLIILFLQQLMRSTSCVCFPSLCSWTCSAACGICRHSLLLFHPYEWCWYVLLI
jgi:hypothetical protein